MSQGRHSRHAAVNKLIRRALASAKVSSHLKPSGTSCANGKRPDGATVLLWKCGQALVWDAGTYAPSHLAGPCCQGGQCSCNPSRAAKDRIVRPATSVLAITLCPSLLRPREYLDLRHCPCWKIGRRIKAETGEPRSFQFLLQGVSVAISSEGTPHQCWARHM